MTDSRATLNLIKKTFSILDYINDQKDYVGISQISSALSMPKANVFRILHTLKEIGVVQESNQGFFIGIDILKYGKTYRDKDKLIEICKDDINKLVSHTGESVNLGIYYKEQVLYLMSQFGEDTSIVSHLIPVSPLYSSAMGKMFLSKMDDNIVKNYYSRNLEKSTVNTITEYQDFLVEKEKILSNKYAIDREEYEYGLTCIAAPLYNSLGHLIAAISLSGPTSRLEYKGFTTMIDSVVECSKEISEKIGKSFPEQFII